MGGKGVKGLKERVPEICDEPAYRVKTAFSETIAWKNGDLDGLDWT